MQNATVAPTLTPAVREWLIELFERTAQAGYHLALRVVWNHDDALDVVQSAFVQAALHQHQLRDPQRSRSWLLGIVYREALTVLRRRREVSTAPSDLVETAQPDADPADVLALSDLRALISAAVGALPEPLRVAFVLRDVEELPMREVAEVLAIGESAAKMRVARARESLRVTLQGNV